jgi:uncharacterized protein with PhoU and TrkA domain
MSTTTTLRQSIRAAMSPREVRVIDYRPDSRTVVRLHSIEATSDAAYDVASLVARGIASAFGLGGAVEEKPGAVFEIYRRGVHVMDVMSA